MSTTGPVIRARYLETELYYLEGWERNPNRPRGAIIYLGAVMCVGVIVVLEIRNPQRVRFWWFAPAAALALAMFMAYRFSPLGQRRMFRSSIRKHLASPPVEAWFEFSDAGFLSTGRGGRSDFHPWGTVFKVVQLADGFLIHFDEHHYYWVPQRAFASSEDYGSVLMLAQAKTKLFQAAKG